LSTPCCFGDVAETPDGMLEKVIGERMATRPEHSSALTLERVVGELKARHEDRG
jgi:hypothetical protein